MKSLTMSNTSTALKHENAAQSANVLMCKQWWKVCWMYGDQEKYYRQLYGKRGGSKNLRDNKKFYNGITSIQNQDSNTSVSAQNSSLHQSVGSGESQGNFYENTLRNDQVSPVNNSFVFEEIRMPSPSSPGLSSLDLTRGIDE